MAIDEVSHTITSAACNSGIMYSWLSKNVRLDSDKSRYLATTRHPSSDEELPANASYQKPTFYELYHTTQHRIRSQRRAESGSVEYYRPGETKFFFRVSATTRKQEVNFRPFCFGHLKMSMLRCQRFKFSGLIIDNY
jgi:hypothetical protein